jgi:hypothetical protein
VKSIVLDLLSILVLLAGKPFDRLTNQVSM